MALEESPGKDWDSVSPLPVWDARRNQHSRKELHQIWDFPMKAQEKEAYIVHVGFIVHLPEMHLLHEMLNMM